LFDEVTIIGLGLIGGSLGLALRCGGVARCVVGVARRQGAVAAARRMGAVDRGYVAIAPAVEKADLVVIATPPSSVVPLAEEVARRTARTLLLTDAASTKGSIVRGWARALPRRIQAVGSHPMAGSEKKGIEAASERLFVGALGVVTPLPGTPPAAVRRVRALWEAVGMRTTTMSPARHDAVVAMVSHVPHLLAAGLVSCATAEELSVAAAGFAEMTRVALGDPALWEDICVTNRAAILRALARVDGTLRRMEKALARGEWLDLRRRLADGRRKRRLLSP